MKVFENFGHSSNSNLFVDPQYARLWICQTLVAIWLFLQATLSIYSRFGRKVLGSAHCQLAVHVVAYLICAIFVLERPAFVAILVVQHIVSTIMLRILDFTKAVTRKMAEKRLIPHKFVQNYIMSRAPKPIAVVLCLTIYSIIYVPFKLSNFGEIVLFIRNYFFFLSFLFGSYFASYAALST